MQLLNHALNEKFSKAHIEDQLRQAKHQLSVRKNQMHSDPLNPMYADHEQKAAENLRKVKDDYTIRTLTIDGTICTEQGKIQEAFLQHFKGIMCCKLENQQSINMDIINKDPILNDQHRNILNLLFSPDEIKDAM